MIVTSKQNPVRGPLNHLTTIAYAGLLRKGMIEWTSGKEWSKEFLGAEHSAALKQWDQKFSDGIWCIDEIEKSCKIGVEKSGFVYEFNDRPVGIMLVTLPKSHVYVREIVASPAASDAGCALLEAAVRWSEREGRKGAVSLHALNEAVSKVYHRYGFRNNDLRREPVAGRMSLDPLTSDAWERTADGLSLKSKIGRDYAVMGLY